MAVQLWPGFAIPESRRAAGLQRIDRIPASLPRGLLDGPGRQLLLCRCGHEQIGANQRIHLLFTPRCGAALGHTTSLRHMLAEHHDDLRHGRQQQQRPVEYGLHRRGADGRLDVRVGVRGGFRRSHVTGGHLGLSRRPDCFYPSYH